jgi:vancomycin resistance protein VanJ
MRSLRFVGALPIVSARMRSDLAWLARSLESAPGPAGATVGGPDPIPLSAKVARWVRILSWSYAGILAGLGILMRVGGDRWWPTTLLMFGPRWAWGAPLCLLYPLAMGFRARSLGPLSVASLLVVGPIMGLCLPWRDALPASGGGRRPLRIVSCNLKWGASVPGALADVISGACPDVVALQGWESVYDLPALLPGPGWHLSVQGELGLASRYPIRDASVLGGERLKGGGNVGRYTLETPEGPVVLFNLHLASPRRGLYAVRHDPFGAPSELKKSIALRQEDSRIASGWAAEASGAVLLAGDFNMPPESAVYRRDWSRYTDAFDTAGFGFGYTWFSRYHGLRIDHILAGPDWRCLDCRVGADVGSDHRPLIAEWVRVGRGP